MDSSAGTFINEEKKEEFLRCPYCFEKFTEPVQMPCLHTVCLKCFKESPKCPFCNTQWGEEEVRPNKQVKEFMKVADLSNCPSCSIRGIAVLNECRHCKLKVCANCMDDHKTKALGPLKQLIQEARQKVDALQQVHENYQSNQIIRMCKNQQVISETADYLKYIEEQLDLLSDRIGKQRSEFENECTQYAAFLSSELRKLKAEPVAAATKAEPTYLTAMNGLESPFSWLKFHQLEEKGEQCINPDFEKIADYIEKTNAI